MSDRESAPRLVRLAVCGARGRMGRRVEDLARLDERFEIVHRLDRSAPPGDVNVDVDVVIDFSSDDGARRALALARAARAALLVGTTSLEPSTTSEIEAYGREAAVMIAPNTSRGAAVLRSIAAVAARALAPDADVDLVEAHHAAKRDAPSGTALRIAEALRDVPGVHLPDDRIHVIRAGGIVGEHAVRLSTATEVLELGHAAISRDVFAAGALDAAAWLCTRPPGAYAIEQALGLEPA